MLAGDPQGRVAVDGENAPANFADQLEMYDAINTVAPSTHYIRSTTAGTVGVRPIDWQNRPTFQQVVTYLRHRPR